MMEERYSKLEITPKLIDFGSRVVQMKLVSSAGIGTIYPWRFLSKPLWLLGALAAVGGYMSLRTVFNPLTRQMESQGGLPILLGLALLLLGLVAWFYQQQLVVIHLAGNERIVLEDARLAFLETIVKRIREAMIAPADAPIQYTINVAAETINTSSLVDLSHTVDQSRTTIANSSGVVVASPGAAAVGGSNSGPIATQAFGNLTSTGVGKANGSTSGERMPAPAFSSTQPAPIVQAATGAVALGGSAYGSTFSTQVGVSHDLEQMIAMVQRAQLQHQEQIVEYLRLLQRIVETSREPSADARQTWLKFVEWAGTALSGIEGFMVLAQRVHRWFTRS